MSPVPVEARTVIFNGPNTVESSHELVPAPGVGQVRIRTSKSLISTGTELTCLGAAFDPDSRWASWVKYPFRPGYAAVGAICDVGTDAGSWKVGDRVAIRGGHSEYINWPPVPPSGQARAKPWRFTRAEINQIHPMVLIPNDFPDEDAVWFALSNIAQMAVRRTGLVLGDAIVVVGCGPLGQMVIRWAKLCGPRRLIAIDPSPFRLALAQRGGATDLVPLFAADSLDAVIELTGGQGADAVYDVTGRAEVLSAAIDLIKRLGTIVLVGDAPNTATQNVSGELIAKGAKIMGVHDLICPSVSTEHAYWTHEKMAQLFFEQVALGRYDLAGLISRVDDPSDAVSTYARLMTSREELGVLFEWA